MNEEKEKQYQEMIELIHSFNSDDFKHIERLFNNYNEYHCRADVIVSNKTLKKIKQLKKLSKTLKD